MYCTWISVIVLLCITLLVQSTNGIVLEAIGYGAAGVVKGSVLTLQAVSALGGGYIGAGLLGLGAAGIAKGSIAAALQSAAASGAGLGMVGVAAVPVALAGGAYLVSTAVNRLRDKSD